MSKHPFEPSDHQEAADPPEPPPQHSHRIHTLLSQQFMCVSGDAQYHRRVTELSHLRTVLTLLSLTFFSERLDSLYHNSWSLTELTILLPTLPQMQ